MKRSALDHKPLPALEAEFRALAAAEPRLTVLERAMRGHVGAHRRDARYCALRAWYGYGDAYGGFKQRLCRLVGYGSIGPLTSSDAYDVAYDWLYTLLPDCRHSGDCG